MEIGDIVEYNGKKIIIDYFIWDDLYNFLETGKEYKIADITHSKKGPPGMLYFRVDVEKEDRGQASLWFPEECFSINYGKKYGLI